MKIIRILEYEGSSDWLKKMLHKHFVKEENDIDGNTIREVFRGQSSSEIMKIVNYFKPKEREDLRASLKNMWNEKEETPT